MILDRTLWFIWEEVLAVIFPQTFYPMSSDQFTEELATFWTRINQLISVKGSHRLWSSIFKSSLHNVRRNVRTTLGCTGMQLLFLKLFSQGTYERSCQFCSFCAIETIHSWVMRCKALNMKSPHDILLILYWFTDNHNWAFHDQDLHFLWENSYFLINKLIQKHSSQPTLKIYGKIRAILS